MQLLGRLMDGPSYTGLIETLVSMTIKLEVIRQTLDPIEDAMGTEIISQIRNDAVKAAAFAQIELGEWNVSVPGWSRL